MSGISHELLQVDDPHQKTFDSRNKQPIEENNFIESSHDTQVIQPREYGMVEDPPNFLEHELMQIYGTTPKDLISRKIDGLIVRKRVDLNIRKGESYKSKNIQPPVIRESDSIASER